MTGTWWPLAALLPLISVTIFPAYCQHTADYKLTFILAIKNNDSGLEVYTVFPENRGSQIDDSGASQWHEHELDPQMHFFFPDRNLSSWCGDQYFRCQELLVEDAGGRFTVVFVPLENGILLLSYWYDLNTTTIEWSSCIVDIYSFNCSPTVFYKISSKFYVVCISSYEYFAVYEVRLNLSGSLIEDATLLGPLTEKCISNSPPSSHISNFALVEHMVCFAIDNTIVVMDIFDSKQTCQYSNNSDCGEIHKLVPTIGDGNQPVLVAYCTDRYIYFDPIYGDWTGIQLFSIHGVPYLCPDKEYNVTLFNNSVGEDVLQFSVRGSVSNTIRNVNISSGICFKSQNRTYFAYSDQQNNSVFVYDFIPRNHYVYPVSPYDCSHLDCPPLLLLGDQYLVVRGADYDLVLDTKTNFSLITNISSDVPDILAVLHSNIITPSPPIIHSTTTVKVPPGMNGTFSLISAQINYPLWSLYTHTSTLYLYFIETEKNFRYQLEGWGWGVSLTYFRH